MGPRRQDISIANLIIQLEKATYEMTRIEQSPFESSVEFKPKSPSHQPWQERLRLGSPSLNATVAVALPFSNRPIPAGSYAMNTWQNPYAKRLQRN
jgi:hypothetical protein